MERCPNCGQMGRAGARFCTICGYRIADDASDGETGIMENREQAATGESNDTARVEASTNWPAPPADDQPPGSAGWAAETPANDTEGTVPPADEATTEEYVSIWSARSGDDWPSPPAANGQGIVPGDSAATMAAPAVSDAIAVEVDITEPAEDPTPNNDAQERAVRLLDEVRGLIATMGAASSLDLSGVIAELEVAVTPPGAINADDLSALRDALLAARERPRDLDTIVDLTSRIDALVALVFAYDRTTAAIERALDVLRRS